GGGSTSYSAPAISTKAACDALCYVLAAAGCVPGPVGCFFAGFSCSVGIGGSPTDPMSYVDCAVGIAGCLFPPAAIPACIYSMLRCVQASLSGGEPAYSAAGGPEDPAAHFLKGVRAGLDVFNAVTGAPDGVWVNPQMDSRMGDWWARFLTAASEGSAGGRWITTAERAELLTGEQPPGVAPDEVNRVLDRWNRSLDNWAQNILRPADAPPGANLDFIDAPALHAKMLQVAAYQQEATAAGFTDPINAIVETVRIRSQAGEEGGVCAKVKIKLDQEAVLSREAFRATLEIDNATANALDSIRVVVRVTDAQGKDANDMFGLRPPELIGISDVDGGGSVAGGAKGTARWVLVPTVDAAPLEPTVYYVGGEFRYTLSGMVVTVPLSPVPITVNPTARLTLDYFHQRDVYSDDPFTDIVEPSIPFNLAVMVNNWGAGAAKNFRITSAQPEIVDNEKGLLIDFKIIATEVAGQNMTPTLTANFGTIPPGGISVARWLMTSTLQGLFINYSATFEHLDGQGNPRLSLIDEVRIHEMIRLVQAGGPFADGKPDFLVNDRADLYDLPDTLWLSDGSSNAVEVVTNAVITGTLSPANLQVQLNANLPGGWAYLRVPDPANGQYILISVTRSDNGSVPSDNAWVTDRTFLGQGRRPKNEHVLHLLDYNSTGQYTLTYALLPAVDNQPPTSSVAALPAQSRSAFLVQWSGEDNPGGSGVATFDIYYSENGGPFQRWLQATPANGAVFQGTSGKTYAFYSVAADQAGNREPVPAAPQAQTTVSLENRPPVFAAQTNVVIVEGATFALTVTATDPDGDALTYQLGAGAPAGLVFNSQSGQMTWITSEAHGPSTNNIRVIARDSGTPSLTATQAFAVIVLESNSPPVLAAITNRTVSEGTTLVITNVASDADLPAQRLTFSLGAGAPAGASINATNGVFTWRPTEFQGGTNYLISIRVTDDGSPSLSATQSFAVVVLDTQADFLLAIGSTAVLSNGVGNVPLTMQAGVELNQVELLLNLSGGRLTNLHLTNLAAQVSANLVPLGANRFRVEFQRQSGASLVGNLTLARLAFAVVPDEHSAVAVLRGESLTGVRTDTLTANGRAGLGRVFVVGR
ncbi:MAG TPA: putative Ig domain-containing protein, partial [Verrucomicrobiae bacterium]